MRAVDTNVIVRLLVEDDRAQAERALKVFAEDEVLFVAKTVLLEAEWVLRGGYNLPRAKVLDALEALLGLKNVAVEAPQIVRKALDWARAGLDFADALHLASIPGSEEGERSVFLTFDRRLVSKAAALKRDVQVALIR